MPSQVYKDKRKKRPICRECKDAGHKFKECTLIVKPPCSNDFTQPLYHRRNSKPLFKFGRDVAVKNPIHPRFLKMAQDIAEANLENEKTLVVRKMTEGERQKYCLTPNQN